MTTRATRSKHPGSRSCGRSRNPIKPTGGLVILKGNLAPDGAVVKVAGYDVKQFAGPARVFDSEEAAIGGGPLGQPSDPGDVRGDPIRGPARRARACARCSP